MVAALVFCHWLIAALKRAFWGKSFWRDLKRRFWGGASITGLESGYLHTRFHHLEFLPSFPVLFDSVSCQDSNVCTRLTN